MIVSVLADAAYDAAYRNDIGEASGRVADIVRLGSRALNTAMLSWVDRAVAEAGLDRGSVLGFVMEMDGTGEEVTADQVRPEVLWAARMVSARIARDGANWKALLMALPPDAEAVSLHIMALLDTVTTTAAAVEEDTQPRTCCVMHAVAGQDARRAVAHLN